MTDLIDTTEMYLRTILELEEEAIVPLRARISERLGHSGPTVSQTVGRMERDGHLTIRLPLIERGVIGRGAVQSSPGKAILMSSGATASPPTTEVSQRAHAFSRSPSALAAIPRKFKASVSSGLWPRVWSASVRSGESRSRSAAA